MTDAERPEEVRRGEAGGEPEIAPEDWPESTELGWTESSAQEMAVSRAMVRRVEWMTGIAGAACALAAAWPLGLAVAAGVLLGTATGWINFRWLASSVNAIGERIVRARKRKGSRLFLALGVGRIVLIGLLGYGIFVCSVRGLMGFLAGLAMPVMAMMCEAAYEFVACNRRSS